MGDLTTEIERELGKLVKAKYHTDFYILHSYPLAVGPSLACQIACLSNFMLSSTHWCYCSTVLAMPVCCKLAHRPAGSQAKAFMSSNDLMNWLDVQVQQADKRTGKARC